MADLSALSRELQGPAPDALASLDAPQIQFLTDCLRSTRHRQQSQLQQAMEAALGHIPLPLRGPVKKILIG